MDNLQTKFKRFAAASFNSNGILTGVTWPTDPDGYSGIKDPDGNRIS